MRLVSYQWDSEGVRRYQNVCWRCWRSERIITKVDNTHHEVCPACGWVICPRCGSCVAPEYGTCPEQERRLAERRRNVQPG